jgi:FAD/FMN-containing dehydrogenase
MEAFMSAVDCPRAAQVIPFTDVERFRAKLRGGLVLPGDPDYTDARKVWNGMIDKRPAAVIFCAAAGDVIEAVDFARPQGLCISVRSRGHNVAGNSVCNGGLVIDLSRMKRTCNGHANYGKG